MKIRLVTGWLLFALILSACSTASANPSIATPTRASTSQPEPETVLETPTEAELSEGETSHSLWVQPSIPKAFKDALILPSGMEKAAAPDDAGLRLEVGDSNPVSRWIYALVVPFPTIQDSTSFDDILRAWHGEESQFSGSTLYLDSNTAGVLTSFWGEPAPDVVQVVPSASLVDRAWAGRPSWSILPFELLAPRWKVLEVDGASPLRKDFDASSYPLVIPFSLNGDLTLTDLIDPLTASIPETNRDPAKLTTVLLTGVTALVRGTSNTMFSQGIDYPAQDIGDWLRDADILHISNEVPFSEDCPLYNPNQTELKFCTNPAYIQLLEDIGTDVVELSGDHFADWGPEATLYTLELYIERGWPYYGGGENLEDGRKPVLLEHNGNRIAFIGCNAKGGGYATASETTPGAVDCEGDWMQSEIRRLRGEGYLVIATMQHQEYYTYEVRQEYREDFLSLARAGASVVSGSQAHIPQAFEFSGRSLIHYGLGNLFFDQLNIYPEASDAFLDLHVFYDGRYLGTDLLTIRFVDYARSRPMTLDERSSLLQTIFTASGW